MLTFKPLSNYVVVENIRTEVSSIVIPETVAKPTIKDKSKNIVVTVSEEKDKDGKPMVRNVKVGDNVMLSINVQHTGQTIHINKTDYIVVREGDILGILEGEEEKDETKVDVLHIVNPKLN